MSAWASHLRRQATRTNIQDMIDYQKRTRSRYPRSGLSLPPRSNSVVTAMVWASSAALNVVVWGASWKGVLSLLDVYRTTPPAEWVSPPGLGGGGVRADCSWRSVAVEARDSIPPQTCHDPRAESGRLRQRSLRGTGAQGASSTGTLKADKLIPLQLGCRRRRRRRHCICPKEACMGTAPASA